MAKLIAQYFIRALCREEFGAGIVQMCVLEFERVNFRMVENPANPLIELSPPRNVPPASSAAPSITVFSDLLALWARVRALHKTLKELAPPTLRTLLLPSHHKKAKIDPPRTKNHKGKVKIRG